jgi:hypothetical protein
MSAIVRLDGNLAVETGSNFHPPLSDKGHSVAIEVCWSIASLFYSGRSQSAAYWPVTDQLAAVISQLRMPIEQEPRRSMPVAFERLSPGAPTLRHRIGPADRTTEQVQESKASSATDGDLTWFPSGTLSVAVVLNTAIQYSRRRSRASQSRTHYPEPVEQLSISSRRDLSIRVRFIALYARHIHRDSE